MLRPSPPTHFRFVLLIAFTFALLSATASARGFNHPRKLVKQQIAQLEEQWRTATLNADIPSMDRLLSDDYVGISWNGQVNTKAMQLDRLKNRSLMISRMDLSDTKVKLLGSVAIVTALAQIEGTTDGIDMTGKFRFTRVYQRLPGGIWKITNFEATRIPDPGERPHHPHASAAKTMTPEP
jgi:ketosteroid isomerase-like protein